MSLENFGQKLPKDSALGRCLLLVVVLSLLSTQPTIAGSDPQAEGEAKPAEAAPEQEVTQTFLEQLTVTATGNERAVHQTPGQVDVIDRSEIEQRGYTGIADLVRYLPGVDVEGDPTRLGANGFTIRGIGGNRVLTEIDGVPSAEQFDFGPFSIFQFALDVDTLESVEIVRSAGSALYGSDALGGVVALTTRSPASYLRAERSYLGLRGGFDGRNDEASAAATLAVGRDSWQGSLTYSRRDGSETDNQGSLETRDGTRTAPNPSQRSQDNALLQVEYSASGSSRWLGAFEFFETDAETEILSSINPGSAFSSAIRQANGFDSQERFRFSLEHSSNPAVAIADSVLLRIFSQDTATEQLTLELREPSLPLIGTGLSRREGLLSFDQETFGGRAEMRKVLGESTLLTYGLSFLQDEFDQFRDRSEFLIETGAPVATSLSFPTKYFPRSEVEELGVFAQAEIELWDGKLSLVPGVRFDRYRLDADQQDEIFLAGNPGTLEPVDLEEQKISPKLGAVLSLSERFTLFAQYARGFRAPPMSAINNGFTNQGGGYRTLPNPDLKPETSDNLELGFRFISRRASFSITAFDNHYDDFIDTVTVGFNPVVFLIEFQPQNVEEVSIRGVEVGGEGRLGSGFTLRGAFTYSAGEDDLSDEPLASIAPPQLVLGLAYASEHGRWGGELIATANSSREIGDLPAGSNLFRVPSSEVLDLTAYYQITERLNLQLTAFNLTDETYWRWAYGRGLSNDSLTLDRFTDPGRSFAAQLRLTF